MLTPKERELLRKLRAMLKSPNENEAENARQKILEFPTSRGFSWNNLDELLDLEQTYNILELIDGLLEKYIWVTPEERLAIALWAIHSFVFDRYQITPRLALLSPVFGCGKTTLMILLEHLVANPSRYDNVTPALLYRQIESTLSPTLLLDEGNNLGLLQKPDLRVVLNANRHGSKIGRAIGKGVKAYHTFAPIAIAAMGILPNDLTQRSIVINMQRHPPDAPPLENLNELDFEFTKLMTMLRIEIQKWADACTLNNNPENPLRNRRADNWRVLFAIADDLGWGKEARAAAVKLSQGLPDDDVKVYLLEDIRDVFDNLGVDRICTALLLDNLCKETMWSDWTGENNDKPPRPLTSQELGKLLRGFKIKAHTIYPPGSRASRGPSCQGFYRRDFELAWASYCSANTPTHQTSVSI
jgi:hypothetical protein